MTGEMLLVPDVRGARTYPVIRRAGAWVLAKLPDGYRIYHAPGGAAEPQSIPDPIANPGPGRRPPLGYRPGLTKLERVAKLFPGDTFHRGDREDLIALSAAVKASIR